MEEYKNKTTREPFIEEFTVDFNTTFTRLEKMQEEIVTKKIEELELALKERLSCGFLRRPLLKYR